jgi:hypothetical protein
MCHFICKYEAQKKSLSKEKVLGILSGPYSEECLVCDSESDSISDTRKAHIAKGV